ncbi:hypothetical protein [Winogradskyella sp. UBA3174]|uniref:hypothetical protein n=1 Tax=Winogradskyella sp. UBA3174 TaxID=1947785 RepID=UPI0025F1EB0F|nr:hypothetical protein [Winogradskyella sp. UBA3174]|tara:strand:+ start:11261 stop:12385 length:1125 start_codon:yes stop_codon:yes gene_type:complete
MTEKNLITFLILFYFSISFGQQKDTIYGKVKSIKEQLAFFDENRQNMKLFSDEGDYGHNGFSNPKFTESRFFNWWYNTPFVHYSNYHKEFNKKGETTYEVWFYKSGDTVAFFNYKYDKNDNLIQVKESYKKDDYTVRNYNYDSKNKIKSTIYYVSDDPNLYSYSEFIYDEKENLIQSKDFNADGETYGTKYTLYSNGKIKEVISYSPFKIIKKNNKRILFKDGIGSEKLDRKFIYNENGDMTETLSYKGEFYNDNEPQIQGRTRKEYANGLLVKEMTLNRANKIERFTLYYYNKQKQITKENYVVPEYPDNNLSYEYFYDNNGNQIKLIYSEKNNPVTVKFKYEFDNQNNWTKQIKSVDGEQLFIWTREFEYFE